MALSLHSVETEVTTEHAPGSTFAKVTFKTDHLYGGSLFSVYVEHIRTAPDGTKAFVYDDRRIVNVAMSYAHQLLKQYAEETSSWALDQASLTEDLIPTWNHA